MAHAFAAAAAAAVALLCFVCLRCRAVDAAAATLSQGQSLAGNDSLTSANGVFSLSFFTPPGGNESRVYLGVLYATAAEQTVAWVANRDAPVSAASAYSATVTASGQLLVLEGQRVVWQTNMSSSLGNITLTMLDSGNLQLVVAGGAQAAAGPAVLWQSFDHPTDTFIPGMSISLERRDGVAVSQTLFTSWRSPVDPAAGNFTLGIDPLGSAQLYIWRKQGGTNITYWRSGQWANGKFVGIPLRPLNVYGFNLAGDVSQSSGVISYTFNRFNTSQYRFVLQPNGTETCYMLLDTGRWEVAWSQPTIPCHHYNICGPNAKCAGADDSRAICTCLPGFEPRSAAEYGSGNWTQGCVRSIPLTCSERSVNTSVGGGDRGDGFADLEGMKLPDNATWQATVADAGACRQSCLANCTCGAYSFSSGGTGCLTWGQELVDIYQFPPSRGQGYDLYIKVPASILDESGSKRRRWITAVVTVVIVVAVVLAAGGLLLWKCRRRNREKLGIVGSTEDKMKRASFLLPVRDQATHDSSGPSKQPDQEEAEHGGGSSELPLFTLEILAAATGGFSDSNKLGQGGFGLVYKGRLPGGEEVAVKRLSKSSGQGGEEFKNEATLIAKLQHRNLVRMLGCCVQGGREDAGVRVHAQQEPRRLPLRSSEARAAGLEDEVADHRGDRQGPPVPPQGLEAPCGAPRSQGQQHPPGPRHDPQDLRLRHGQDLRRRPEPGEHQPRRRHHRVHVAGVRDGGAVLGEVRRVQLRHPGPGDHHRPEEQQLPPHGGLPQHRRLRVAAVECGQGGAAGGSVNPGCVLGVGAAGGCAVRPHGSAVRAGLRERSAGHPVRGAGAGERRLPAADAEAAHFHAAVHVVGQGRRRPVRPGTGRVLLRQRSHRHHAPREVVVYTVRSRQSCAEVFLLPLLCT